jgi:hypothetical protein
MEARDRLLAPCVTLNAETNKVTAVDIGALVTRLLLFDHYILDSVRLGEFPHLVGSFGIDGVERLLGAGCFEIHCDARTVGQTGQLAVLESRAQQGVLPIGSYSFALIGVPDRKEYLHGCLQEVQKELGVSTKEAIKLKKALMQRIIDPPDSLGHSGMAQMNRDLADNRDIVRTALTQHLRDEEHLDVQQAQVQCAVEQIAEGDFKTTTNLQTFGFNREREHKIVERALLGVGGLNLRLDQMEALHVMSGFREHELPIFDSKLDFVARHVSPEAQVERFSRIVSLVGLPDPSYAVAQGEKFDIAKLLEVRESAECREFRTWLRSLDEKSDKEIKERVESFKAKVSEAMKSAPGRAVRFGVVTAAGLIPGAGLALGPGLGAIDNFVVDKILGDPGPAAFLSHEYMSLFGGQ